MTTNVPPSDPPSKVEGDEPAKPQKPKPHPRPRRAAPPTVDFLERLWPWVVRFTGIGIALWETLEENYDRPSLLLLAAGMIGLGEIVRVSRNGKNGNGNGGSR